MVDVKLQSIELPDFGLPTVEPALASNIYEARIEAALSRAAQADYQALVIYGDREHHANLAYLTGVDPRFEEAMLVLKPGITPALLVGNEGWGYADISPIELKKVLYQSFSLLSQPRDKSKPLAAILADEAIGKGSRVGVAGWKYFGEAETGAPRRQLEIPSYIVDTLRDITGDPGLVENANDLFMNADDGLRVINELDQLAAFEYASCHTSTAVRNMLFGLQPGMSEYEAVQLMRLNGMPLSCHLMLSSGPRATLGLPSPSSRIIERGDRFTAAFGIWGALNCRAGFVVKDAEELPEGIRDYADRLVAPYFRAIAEWYRTVGIGVTGDELYQIIDRHLGDPFFGISLNPGHQIHLDEWVNSPIFAGSEIELKSGMALQVDVIPATGTDYFTTNIEDGIALADADLRDAFARKYPEAWNRIQARRNFMADKLGIRLKPEVLPFSNIPAYLPPFLLQSDRVMTLS